jgi:hypothetical protein
MTQKNGTKAGAGSGSSSRRRTSNSDSSSEIDLVKEGIVDRPIEKSTGAAKNEARRRSPQQKRDKFKDLVKKRVPKAEWSIRNIGKLANSYAYDFDEKDIRKIVSHLQKELDEMESRFYRAISRESRNFTLD